MRTPERSSRGANVTPLAKRGAGVRTIRGLDPDQRRAQRREQLLAAALELFADKGYLNTSIEQICQAAYVGNKAFYELFASKEDCYAALLSKISERIKQQVRQAAQQLNEEDPDEAIGILLSVFAHAAVDDPRVAVVAFRDVGGISSEVERQRRENRRWVVSFFEQLWRRFDFERNHTIGDSAQSHALALGTAGGLFEIVASWLHGDSPHETKVPDLISDLTAFVTLVQDGLLARHSQSGPGQTG